MASMPLYSGSQGPSGMPVPILAGGGGIRAQAPTLNPTGGAMPVPASPAPAGAPNLLNVSQNPTGTGSTPPGGTVAPIGTGAPGTNTGTFGDLTSRQASRVLGENQNYLGEGMGALATSYLQSGAGYNGPLAQQTITATDNAMQQQINQQYGALQTSMADAGLSPDSSGFSLASSEFLSNASAQENEVAAQQYTQMYSQAQQDYLSELQALQGYNFEGTMNQRTALGAIGSFLTGGVGGLIQYEGGPAGTAGGVTSTGGIMGSGGLSTAVGSAVGSLPGGAATTVLGSIV